MSLLSSSCCLLSASALLGLAACSMCSSSPEVAPGSAAALAERSDVLVQTHWQLVRWMHPDGKSRTVPRAGGKTQPITLSFARNGSLPLMFGFAGCNRYSGSYVVANGQLVVTNAPVSTRMACTAAASAKLEQDYLSALTDIRASRLEGEPNPTRLTLELGSGDVLFFERLANPGQPGASRAPEARAS